MLKLGKAFKISQAEKYKIKLYYLWLKSKKKKYWNLIATIADGCYRFEMDKVGQYFGGGGATL